MPFPGATSALAVSASECVPMAISSPSLEEIIPPRLRGAAEPLRHYVDHALKRGHEGVVVDHEHGDDRRCDDCQNDAVLGHRLAVLPSGEAVKGQTPHYSHARLRVAERPSPV